MTYCDAGEMLPFELPLDVMVRAGGVTTKLDAALVLPVKLASPTYWAVTDFVPAVCGVKSQLPLPAANVMGHVAPVPSLTVTEPVGVPPPEPATVTDTVVALPRVIGLGGTSPVIVVVVVSKLAGSASASKARPAVSKLDARAAFKLEEIQRMKIFSPSPFI